MAILSKQQLHQLAMNIVGKELEKKGFEFLTVNSIITKNPQFVVLRNKKLHFVIVRAIEYPNIPNDYDKAYLEKVKNHANKYNAKTYYAGVGLANNIDYELPVDSDENYVVNFSGLIEIK